jgi:hypothetical protein
MKPEDCSRYEACNANICPLDAGWRLRSHLPGEAVCFWLRERSKEGWEARLTPTLLPNMLDRVSGAYQELTLPAYPPGRGHNIIQDVLLRAAKSGSKLESGRKLRATRESNG